MVSERSVTDPASAAITVYSSSGEQEYLVNTLDQLTAHKLLHFKQFYFDGQCGCSSEDF